MSDIILSWSSIEQLIPLCQEFKAQRDEGEDIDIQDAAYRLAAAFGIEDLDAEAMQKVNDALRNGMADALGDEGAGDLAKLFAGMAKPAMSLVFEYAKGGQEPGSFITGLNKVCSGNVESMQGILQNSLGVPDQAAEFLADKCGPYLVSIYCFAAAFKIYRHAAKDAELARQHREEIERLTAETIQHLSNERREMESMLGEYMLDRLLPFSEGMAAMDQAILADDDDGYIAANAQLWELFGHQAQYTNASEFDDLMLSDEVFKL